MGAFCSCFTGQHEENPVHSSTNRNITHQNSTPLFSLFKKTCMLWPMRVRPSPNQVAPSEIAEAVTNGSCGSGATRQEGTSEDAALYSCSSDECCPTCFETYTEENPKITTQCSHHFHLPCIFEWMERSDTCPFCRQELVLGEGFES